MDSDKPDDFWDDLFHGCAWAAYIDQTREEACLPPDPEAIRQRAYRYYEAGLAERRAAKLRPDDVTLVEKTPERHRETNYGIPGTGKARIHPSPLLGPFTAD